MKILLTNDDGYDSKNIEFFYNELSKQHDVWLIAPKNNCSGKSAAISFLNEINGWQFLVLVLPSVVNLKCKAIGLFVFCL